MGIWGPNYWFISQPEDLKAVVQEPRAILYREVIDGDIDYLSNLNIKGSQAIIADQFKGLNLCL